MVGEKCYEAPHGIGQVHSATGSLEGGGGVAYQGVWLCVYMHVCVPVLCMRACVHVCVCVRVRVGPGRKHCHGCSSTCRRICPLTLSSRQHTCVCTLQISRPICTR